MSEDWKWLEEIERRNNSMTEIGYYPAAWPAFKGDFNATIACIKELRAALEKYANPHFDWGYDHSVQDFEDECDYGDAAKQTLAHCAEGRFE